MPLQKQLIQVPLSLGLDQKTELRELDAQHAVQMVNCVRLNNGDIRKRFGNTALSRVVWWEPGQNFNISSPVAGFSIRGQNVLADRTACYIYSETTQTWSPSFPVPALGTMDRIPLIGSMTQPIEWDAAIGTTNNLMVSVSAALDSTIAAYNILYCVLDMTPSSDANQRTPMAESVVVGQVFGVIAQPTTLTGLRVIVCGSTAICVYQQNGASDLIVQTLNLGTVPIGTGVAVWSAPFTLVTPGGGALGAWDVQPVMGDPTRFVAVYPNAAGTTVTLNVFTVSTLVSSLTRTFDVFANFNTPVSMTVAANNLGHYWFAYTCTAGASMAGAAGVVRAAFWNETGNVSAAPITIESYAAGVTVGKVGIDATEAQGAFAAWSTGYAAGQTAMQLAYTHSRILTDIAGSVGLGFNGNTRAVHISTRPWISSVNNALSAQPNDYFGAVSPSLLQGTNFVMQLGGGSNDVSVLRPAAIIAPRLTKAIPTPLSQSFSLPNAVRLSNLPGAVVGLPVTISTQQFRSSTFLAMVDNAPTRHLSGDELGGSRMTSAAIPTLMDGTAVSESAFCTYPEITATASAGGPMATGTYQYIAYYEARDASGQVHRSATSVAASVTLTAGNGSVIVVIPLPATMRGETAESVQNSLTPKVYIALYRTTSGGTLFYRVTPDPPTRAWSVQFLTAAMSFTDTTLDAALTATATAQLLYTTGGVLDNFTPPGCRVAVKHVNRFFLAGCDEPTQVWVSKALTFGESPGFNEVMNFNATGAVRAMASLDDKLMLFVQRGTAFGIEYVTGQGPTDVGTQSDFTPPQPIPCDVGAIDQRGTCVGPFGILFRSTVGGPNGSGGIHLLGRDLSVRYVGGPVQDLLNSNPVVTSMVPHPTNGRVYVTCVPTDVGFTSGVRLVWDYNNGDSWSSDQLFDADTGQTSAGARCAWVANAPQGISYFWATASGRPYRETFGIGANSYMDGSHYVQMTYQSSWLKPQIGGFARFWNVQLRADSLESHDFSLTLTYDYAPSSYYSESHTWTRAQMAAFDRQPQINVQMTPGTQKAEAIQFTLVDATPTGGGAVTGQGPSWASVVLELGVKEGAYRNIPPAQRA